MQRVGPKETMDERHDSSSYVMGVCKLVFIFMSHIYIIWIFKFKQIIYNIYIYMIHIWGGRHVCFLLHLVMVCHGQLIETVSETGQEFAVEVALSHPGGEFQRLAVVTVQ